jgi:hypothetical protein
VKRVISPLHSLFRTLLCDSTYSGPIRQRTRSETCKLVSFGRVEPNRILIMTPKHIMKLGFGFTIMP